MSVALAQPPVYASSATSTVVATLGAAPTPGNSIYILGASGSTNSPTCPGFSLIAYGIGNGDDIFAIMRIVQSGDAAGPFTVSGNNAGNDIGIVMLELAGAGSSPKITTNYGDVTWNGRSMPSLSIAAPAGSFVAYLFSIFTGSASYTVGTDSLSSGTYDTSFMAAASSSNRSYFGFGHQSFSAAGTALTTFTAPNVGVAASTQDGFALIVAPAAASAVGNSDNPGGAIGNGQNHSGVIGNGVPSGA